MGKKWVFTPEGQLQSKLGKTPKMCATLQSDSTVSLAPCSTPVPANQKVQYDSASQQLTVGNGMCVTADPGDIPGSSKIKAEAIILGRPLAPVKSGVRKSYALLFINNMQSTETITCNSTCLGKLGITQKDDFTITDVISGDLHLQETLHPVGSISTKLTGYGASRYLRLDSTRSEKVLV